MDKTLNLIDRPYREDNVDDIDYRHKLTAEQNAFLDDFLIKDSGTMGDSKPERDRRNARRRDFMNTTPSTEPGRECDYSIHDYIPTQWSEDAMIDYIEAKDRIAEMTEAEVERRAKRLANAKKAQRDLRYRRKQKQSS